jgi:Rps23 Pro-64 3,4-dihydroxylase Tpa1-like proline 4-hydroxylase
LPVGIAFLTSAAALNQLRSDIGALLGANLDERVEVTAHKLIPGQRIRIHNDFVPAQETHRLLIQLNRGWSEANGGLLMLFADPDPKSVSRIILPGSRSAFGFSISPRSFHAVTPIRSGERFTLVYSFYERFRRI